MEARLIACNIPTEDHAASNTFYAALLGIEPARSLTDQLQSYHLPISNDGQYLWLSDKTVAEEQPACVFAVDDLDAAINELTQNGGQQMGGIIDAVVAPEDQQYYEDAVKKKDKNSKASAKMGRTGYLRDPDGNVLMLFEVAGGADVFFGTGKHKRGLNQDVLSSHAKALARGKTKH